MTSGTSNINHRATIYIYWISELGILGPATPNTPIFVHDQWDFKEQPQGHNLHILDFWIGHFGAGHTKYTRFCIWPVGLQRATKGPQVTFIGFFKWEFWGQPHQTHQFRHMTSGNSKRNHRATIYIYWIFQLGILGPATPNTPVLAYDQWGFQYQPQGQNLHVCIYIYWIFQLGILVPATPNTPVFAYDQWNFKEQPQGHNLHILHFLNWHFGADHTKHTSFGIWPARLPRGTTGPQFTYTWFLYWAFWGRPHQTHQFWHMTSGASNISHRATIYIYWISESVILGPATPNTPVLHMTSGTSKSNHRATIYIYLIFVLGILGPATPNTPVLAYDHWGFQDQPQGHTLHILDFLIGHFRASHIKHNSFGIWPVRLLRATQGHYLHILDFWIGNFWAGHTKHTSFGIWPVGLQRETIEA